MAQGGVDEEPRPDDVDLGPERAGVPAGLARLDGEAGAGASGEDIGRELFRLVVKAREAGRDPEMELRAAARRYRDLVRAWEGS